MKHRCALLALALLLLCSGCAEPLVPNEYTVVTEHAETMMEEKVDALTAESYEDLKYAVLSLIEGGAEHGVIRAYNYEGDVTKDISSAAYEVWKNDPMGAYAVEFITTDCNLLLSYYEIHVEITYRDTAADADEIRYVRGRSGTQKAVSEALENMDDALVLRISAYDESMDIEAMVQDYCAARPETQMEIPEVSVAIYPEEGTIRIVEIDFSYENSVSTLSSHQSAVNTVLNAATNYVSYRAEDRAKAELLFSYLIERFEYTEGETKTPVYSLLCEGIANSKTFARIFQVLCDRTGLECQTVNGYLDGMEYSWNILCIDGIYGHVDLMRAVREGIHQLVLYTDQEMERYSWDRDACPTCSGPEVTVTEQDQTEGEDQPSEEDVLPETPSEEPETDVPPEEPTVPEES